MSAFLAAAFVVLAAVGVVLSLALRQAATAEAIRDARNLTSLEAQAVVGPLLTDAALDPGPARNALDEVVRSRVLGLHVVRLKIWDETGTIRYSDHPGLIGARFPLPADERSALLHGHSAAEVSQLGAAENRDERRFGKLLQVYLGVQTTTGRRLLFETYQPYSAVAVASRRLWLTSLPVLGGGLVLLYLLQAPLAYRMAHRLRVSSEERESLLLASLASSDRERGRIAADLHDGIVQGLTGTSFALSAAAARSGGADPAMAAVLARSSSDLRRWVRELRSLVVTITPPALHAQGLDVSLADLAATLEARGIEVRLEVTGTADLPEEVESLAYRAAQEAVRNVVRHAQATEVDVEVTHVDGELMLCVRDDGQGFDLASGAARRRGSVGLDLLRALVESQGGRLTITSQIGRGTQLALRLPVPQGSAGSRLFGSGARPEMQSR